MNNYNYENYLYPTYSNDNNFVGYDTNLRTDIEQNRINYIPNIDPNLMQFLNQNNSNPNMMNNNSNMINNNNQLLEPYEGFIRGNMFKNLYDQYKNFKPQNIKSNSERENMLNQWQQYNFVLTDIKLDLDVNPNNRNLLDLYKQYLKIANDIKDQYEKKYGPITCDSEVILNSNNWTWNDSPWPWEVM